MGLKSIIYTAVIYSIVKFLMERYVIHPELSIGRVALESLILGALFFSLLFGFYKFSQKK